MTQSEAQGFRVSEQESRTQTFFVPRPLPILFVLFLHQSKAQSPDPQHFGNALRYKFYCFLATSSFIHNLAASSDDTCGNKRIPVLTSPSSSV